MRSQAPLLVWLCIEYICVLRLNRGIEEKGVGSVPFILELESVDHMTQL